MCALMGIYIYIYIYIIVICKNSIIPKASPAPNGIIEEKLKSLGKKKFSTNESETKVP